MKALLRQIRLEAPGIRSYRLEPLPNEQFPQFEAGAHIDVSVSDGLLRSYSLVNDPSDSKFYEIAVQLDVESRGGSETIHKLWQVGQEVEISVPKNNFGLDETSEHSVLIAGGIGITPMMAMIARLETLGKNWELHYVSRTQSSAAYLEQLQPYENAHVIFHDNTLGLRMDMAQIISEAPSGSHFYCCGPERMLASFQELTSSKPKENIHYEYFSADTDVALDGGYKLQLQRSNKTVEVEKGETILDALLMAGVDIGFACSEGVCGTCEVKVLDGVPDHRDHFLSEADKETNKAIMVCCSGSKSETLVLDI